MPKINNRLKQIIDYKANGNVNLFSKKIKISQQKVNRLFSIDKRTNKWPTISTDIIISITEMFVDINIDWLLTGKGNMINTIPKSEKKLSQSLSLTPSQPELKCITFSEEGIPLIPVEAMAGWGAGDVPVMEYDLQRYKVPEFSELNVDFMIRVKGSSMYPKYNSGDIVACKKLPLDTFFQWNKVYVLDTIQGAMIKRIKQSEVENAIQCVSDNKTYDPFDLDLSEVHALALVVGVIRLE